MAVYRLFKNKAFEPEAITMMTSAYADVCRTLGVSERDDPEANTVAQESDRICPARRARSGPPAGARPAGAAELTGRSARSIILRRFRA